MIFKENKNGSTTYLNLGDWVENLTALKYNKKRWKLYKYSEANYSEDENFFEMVDSISNQLVASYYFSNKIFYFNIL